MLSDLVQTISDVAIFLMETLGAPGAGVAIALENLFPPMPSELILPLAGYTVAQGQLSLLAVIIWTTAGSLTGALALYGLGAWLGRERLRRIVDAMPLVSVADLDKAEAFFARHGAKAVLFGRMVPLVRSLISVPAGIERMSLPRFAALTTLGSAVWNCLLIGAGYLLGANWHLVESYVGVLSKIVLGVLVAGVAAFMIMKLRRRTDREPRVESVDARRGP